MEKMTFYEGLTADELKRHLLTILKSAYKLSYAIRFCDLLIRGRKLILKQSRSVDPYIKDLLSSRWHETAALLNELKELVAAVSPRVLVKEFSAALRVKFMLSDNQKLLSCLLEINDSKTYSLENLKVLIENIDSIVRTYSKHELLIHNSHSFAEDLKMLTFYVEDRCYMCARDVFDLILQMHIDDVVISPNLRKLFFEAADCIEVFLEDRIDWERYYKLLIKRSVLQFILDSCDEFCLSRNWLKIIDCMGDLDEFIEIENLYFAPYVDDEDALKIGKSMPSTHSWWKLCSKDVTNGHL